MELASYAVDLLIAAGFIALGFLGGWFCRAVAEFHEQQENKQ